MILNDIMCLWFVKSSGGEAGIRTPGGLIALNGFQDRRLKPLGHFSALFY